MAGTYGEPGKNPFTIPGIGGVLSPVVNDTTGVIQVYRQGSLNTFQSLGTLNPKTNKFTFDPNSGLSSKEIARLSEQKNIKTIKDAGSIAVSKGVQEAGGTVQDGENIASDLIRDTAKKEEESKKDGGIDLTITDIEGVSDRSSYGPYVYPQSLDLTTQDVIKFTMIKPVASKFNAEFGAKTLSSKYSIDNNLGYVILPVQPSISDSNTVRWSGLTLNAFEAYGAGQAINLAKSSSLTELFAKAGASIQDIAGKFLESSQLQQAAQIGLAQEAVGIQGLLSRATGAILNPNLELLFEGPELRTFGFTFRMSPRNKNDAYQVRSIIRFFKQGMSVKTTSSSIFLKSPHVFKIQYQTPKREDHPSINRIKICALVGCDVDYTPDGTYMTFNDEEEKHPMTSYGMSLRFSEIEPIYDQDYAGLPEDEIGY